MNYHAADTRRRSFLTVLTALLHFFNNLAPDFPHYISGKEFEKMKTFMICVATVYAGTLWVESEIASPAPGASKFVMVPSLARTKP